MKMTAGSVARGRFFYLNIICNGQAGCLGSQVPPASEMAAQSGARRGGPAISSMRSRKGSR